MKDIIDWIEFALNHLQSDKTAKLESTRQAGVVKAYWAGSIIRIDFMPKESK